MRHLTRRRVLSIAVAAILAVGTIALLTRDGGGGRPAEEAQRSTMATIPTRVLGVRVDAPSEFRAKRGEAAPLRFEVRPGSSCQLEVQTGSGRALKRRLPVLTAGADGVITWEWSVGKDIPPGLGHAVVVCSGGATAEVPIQVD